MLKLYIFINGVQILFSALEFNPDFTIISAGFDAARGDPLGCCNVSNISMINYQFLFQFNFKYSFAS